MSTLRANVLLFVFFLLAVPLYLLSSNFPSASETSLSSFRYREDINRDGKVSIMDALDLLIACRSASVDPEMDLDRDGKVNICDVIDMLRKVTRSTCTPLEKADPYFRPL